jgi:hypothetical protein
MSSDGRERHVGKVVEPKGGATAGAALAEPRPYRAECSCGRFVATSGSWHVAADRLLAHIDEQEEAGA